MVAVEQDPPIDLVTLNPATPLRTGLSQGDRPSAGF